MVYPGCDHPQGAGGGAARFFLAARRKIVQKRSVTLRCVTLRCVTLRCVTLRPAERSEAVPPSEARPSRRTKRSEAVPPSEARPSRRAKRGSTEARPSEARPREGHREVAITKKLKKVPPESPGEPLILLEKQSPHQLKSVLPEVPPSPSSDAAPTQLRRICGSQKLGAESTEVVI